MPSTSPMQFIVDSLVTVLTADTTLSVERVWNGSASSLSKTVCYPYVNGVGYEYDMESGASNGRGTASCEILCDAVCDADAAKTGKSTAVAGLIGLKLKKLFDDKDWDTVARNDDGTYYTKIHAANIDAHVGHMDIGKGRVQMGFAVTVHFSQYRKT